MKKSTTTKNHTEKRRSCPLCKSRMTHDADNNLWCEQCNHTEED